MGRKPDLQCISITHASNPVRNAMYLWVPTAWAHPEAVPSTTMDAKEVLVPEPPPLGDVDSDPTPFQLSHHYSVVRSEGGTGNLRHRDYSGFHHRGTDGLIRVELWLPTHEL